MARPISERLEERSREVAALAAEVERLRMALGAVRIVTSKYTQGGVEIHAIVKLALERPS